MARAAQASDVIYMRSTASPYCPAYVLALDPPRRAVVLAVRGTQQLKDLVTNLCSHSGPFFQGAQRIAARRAARSVVWCLVVWCLVLVWCAVWCSAVQCGDASCCAAGDCWAPSRMQSHGRWQKAASAAGAGHAHKSGAQEA